MQPNLTQNIGLEVQTDPNGNVWFNIAWYTIKLIKPSSGGNFDPFLCTNGSIRIKRVNLKNLLERIRWKMGQTGQKSYRHLQCMLQTCTPFWCKWESFLTKCKFFSNVYTKSSHQISYYHLILTKQFKFIH